MEATESNNRDQQSNHPSLGENEEEYLRSTWGKLGVGQDGYLDQTQLALVCECIGMEKLSDEVQYTPHTPLEVSLYFGLNTSASYL